MVALLVELFTAHMLPYRSFRDIPESPQKKLVSKDFEIFMIYMK